MTEAGGVVLSAEQVTAGYGRAPWARPVLREVSVAVPQGRTLGIVGESGSGKSTLAKVLAGQLAPTSGRVLLDGRDIAGQSRRDRYETRRHVQLIPQDPYSSLDPRMPVERALAEAIQPRGRLRVRVHRERIVELLESVALDASAASRHPNEFSGGQRQRIAIARALAVRPRVVIADEITSALDTPVQAGILDLLRDLQARLGLTIVFITHDLAVAQHLCSDLTVLYLGRVVEQGGADVLADPGHPYSELLRASVPDGGAMLSTVTRLATDVAADPADPPAGCVFHPGCPYGPAARDDRERCATDRPDLAALDGREGRLTACHFPLSANR